MRRMSSKGQVTIPKQLRDRAGIPAGSAIEFGLDGTVITLRRAQGKQPTEKSRGQRMVEALRGTTTINRDLSTDEIMRLLRGETYAEEFERTETAGFAEDKAKQRLRGDD